MVYLLIILLLLILSYRYDICKRTKGRDFWYFLLLLIFIFVAGLRWRLGIDTTNYLYRFYHEYPTLDKFSISDYPIGKDPLYVLMNSFIKTLGCKFFIFQIIHAVFINTLIFNFFKKHSPYVFTCIFFYFLMSYTGYNMQTMRASMSIVVCLYANEYILNKKWLKGYLLYFIAILFHAQTILILITPLLFFMRLNAKGIVMLAVFFVLGKIIALSLGDYAIFFEAYESVEEKVSVYAASEKFGEQMHNINFIIVNMLPVIFYVIFTLIYVRKNVGPNGSLLRFEPMLLLGLCFVMIRINFEIAYRYTEYYVPYFVLFYSQTYVTIAQKKKNISKSLAYTRAFTLFSFIILSKLVALFASYEYNPYTSIINKHIVTEREKEYIERIEFGDYYPPSYNEY